MMGSGNIIQQMFERIVQKILNRILGQYVENFNSDNLNIGIWKGQVSIQNVQLKRDVIKKLNLPFNIKYSKLGSLKMNIPWSSLGSSKIDIFVEGLELIVNQVPERDWQCKNVRIIEHRKKEIQSYCDEIIADFGKKAEMSVKEIADKEQGFFGAMVVKIIDNLQIVVKDIHVRFEDEITKKFSFGISLQQLKIYTVNKQGEPEFIDRTKKAYQNEPLRKKLFLSNLGIYWNENTSFFNPSDPHPQMLATIPRQDKKASSNIKMNYLILMSFNAMLYQREAGKQFQEPEINLLIEFNELKVEITNQQLQQIVELGERLQKFSNEVKMQNRKKLTQLEMIANREIFMKLFPKYFEKKCTAKQMGTIEDILQKMETSNFEEGIKQFLQQKQKQKMIQERIQKSTGWFTGPKELTEQEQRQIQKFLTQNFGKETKTVKRPQNFYYIRVNFNLKILQLSIANKNEDRTTEGIRLKFNEIKMQFSLRQEGYMINFAMNDIRCDLFKYALQDKANEETINIVQKIRSVEKEDGEYVRLQVFGNPLHKRHLNQEIIVRTEELMIQFHPRIIKIAKQFADIRLSSENSEAALEAYGQFKNKASTAANQSLKKPFQKKSFISIDVKINAISLLLFFDPLKTNADVWVLKIGEINVFSDPEVLKKIEFHYDEPMQKYGLSFAKLSFMHFASKKAYFYNRSNEIQIDNKDKVVSDLGIDFQLELFKDTVNTIPKIRLKTVLHNIEIFFSAFTYDAIQKIPQCFSIAEQKMPNEELQKQKLLQKASVMKEAKKIGVVYQQSKSPKKYIGVLKGSYLYLYKDKKDLDYTAYYYLKNCQVTYNNETSSDKKMFEVRFWNSVNELVLGFERVQPMEEWVRAIRSIDDGGRDRGRIEEKEVVLKRMSSIKENPNKLNFEVCASIQQVKIITLLPQQKQIQIEIQSLDTKTRIHQCKNTIEISLRSVWVSDNLHPYRYRQLNNLLFSTAIPGKEKLIEINVLNNAVSHPEYDRTDVKVWVEFGRLDCNYRPQAVQRLMNFYVPKDGELARRRKLKGEELTKEEKEALEVEKKRRRRQNIESELKRGIPETFILQINLKIKQISASFVNRNNKVMFARVGLSDFNYSLAISTRQISMTGSLQEMWVGDYSDYPDTIYQERDRYSQVCYLVQSYNNSAREMLKFGVRLIEIPDEAGKSLFVKVNVYDVKASYIQQPVLRIITYILEQVLPSLTPPEDLEQVKEVPKNDTKPNESTMVLQAYVENALAIVEPRCKGQPQYLQLEVKRIEVKNSSHYRPYIKQSESEQEQVLVENYFIKMQDIKIMQKFKGRETKLTNDLNFSVSCDLIQNSPYYKKVFKERFDAGMRIECELSPFVMCLNHDDYNFIMKCLYWNITYDDNAEGYFFTPISLRQTIRQMQTTSDPIHFGLSMTKIILCVTENNFPLSVLLLNQMRYDLTLEQSGMYMTFKMKHLSGTTISKTKDEKVSLERGMFNSFGYEKRHMTANLYDMNTFVTEFARNELMYSENLHNENALYFKMTTNSRTSQSFITLKIKDIGIAIEVKTLITLSKLALMEEYIQPPKSEIVPVHVKPKKEGAEGSMAINLEMDNFLGCLGDRNFQNYIVMSGEIYLKMKLVPGKSEEQLLQLARREPTNGKFRDSSTYQVEIKNYSLYFCNVNDLKNKRYLLLPLNVFLMYRQFYGKIKEVVFMENEVDGMLGQIVVECSIKDLLLVNKIMQENLEVLATYQRENAGKEKLERKISVKAKEKELSKLIMKQEELPRPPPLALRQSLSFQPNHQDEMPFSSDSIHIDSEAVARTVKQITKKIKTKTKATIKMQPIQLRVVNDCGYNFMPVIKFIAQDSTLMFSGDAIKNLFMLALTFNLDFFNPRSASWEPIIETYKIAFDYLQIFNLNNHEGQKTRLIITGTQIEQLKQLKFNISTQLITTILATMEIAKKQRKSLYEFEGLNSKEVAEISPYIVENKTNYPILIYREIDSKKANIEIQPLFKGQLRMNDKENRSDKGELLRFQYRNRVCETGMEKFGYVSIPKVKDLHLQFKIDKLNRIICFVDRITIKNSTNTAIFCVRYSQKRQKIEQQLQILPQDSIPVKQLWYIQFSFNKRTFTPPTKISSLSQMYYLKAESQKFKLSITKRESILSHQVISIRAPFLISNCLPKDIKLQFISNGKHVSTREITAQTTHEVFANEDVGNFRFKVIAEGFYWSEEFGMDFDAKDREKEEVRIRENVIQLNDREKGFTQIMHTFEHDPKKRQYRLSLSCPAFILSQLQEDVNIYGNLKEDEKNKKIQKYHQLGGQSEFWKIGQQSQQPDRQRKRTIDKITIVGAEIGSKLRICGHNCIIDFSEPFNINSIGVHQARVVVQREIGARKMSVFTMLGLEIELKKMTKRSHVICKQITIRYRYIISNISGSQLFIREEGSQKLCFHVGKGEKKPFYYTVPSIGIQARNMIVKTPDTLQSLPLASNSLGVAYFRLKLKKHSRSSIKQDNPNSTSEYLYYKLNTQQLKSYIFYQFSSISYNDLPYEVQLKSQKFKIFVPAFEKVLTKNSDPLLFINEIPQYGYKLFMLVNLVGTEQSEEVSVEADNLNFRKNLYFKGKGMEKDGAICYIHIILNDSKKVILIDQISHTEQQSQHEQQTINIRIEKLSLSLIQNHTDIDRPYESFYLYLYNLELIMEKSNINTKYQARLQFLQFDQQEPFNIPDPVILTAEKFKQHTGSAGEGGVIKGKVKIKSIFNVYVEMDNRFVKNLCFNCIKIEINNVVVRATTYLIKLILGMVKEYNDVFKNENQFLIQKHTNTWQLVAIPPQGTKTFIKSIKIAPFTVLISAMIRVDEQDIESALFRTFLNALGVVITDIDNAPIIFDGILLDNCIDSVQGIQHKLIEHYKASVMRQLYKILGSLNIIGNPVSLFRNISTGIQDLKDKPAEGFVAGPLEFGKGIADGTSSLIAHSIGGALNSVEKVTGTIATGLAVLTFDKEFQEAREKEKMKKPKHLFEGLEKGGRAVFHGFKEGITGVVTKPIEQTKKSGALGLVKGVGQGLAGLVVKPVTGIVDFASKTTQGLKNTAMYLEDKPNQNRIRFPRVFYTECFIIREYNAIDSKILSIINRTKYEQKYGFQNSIFISAFQLDKERYLLVLKEDIVMVRIDNDKIQWVIPIESLNVNKEMDVETGAERVRISADSRREWYSRRVNDVVEFRDRGDGDAFLKLMDDLRANMKDRTINESYYD